jgi:hypothetical protein
MSYFFKCASQLQMPWVGFAATMHATPNSQDEQNSRHRVWHAHCKARAAGTQHMAAMLTHHHHIYSTCWLHCNSVSLAATLTLQLIRVEQSALEWQRGASTQQLHQFAQLSCRCQFWWVYAVSFLTTVARFFPCRTTAVQKQEMSRCQQQQQHASASMHSTRHAQQNTRQQQAAVTAVPLTQLKRYKSRSPLTWNAACCSSTSLGFRCMLGAIQAPLKCVNKQVMLTSSQLYK